MCQGACLARRESTPKRQRDLRQEYRDISSFRNAARQDELALKNVKLFFREPQVNV
jgi:hypothetical protein